MKLPQFTVRRLMVAVAITGFGLEGGIVGWRWVAYRSLASRNEQMEQHELIKLNYIEHHSEKCCLPWVVPYYRKIVKHHGFLKRKYEVAMTRPWFPVEPDPPEPE